MISKEEIADRIFRSTFPESTGSYRDHWPAEYREQFEAAIERELLALVTEANVLTVLYVPLLKPLEVRQAIRGIQQALLARLNSLASNPNDTAANLMRQVIDAMNLIHRISTHPAIVELEIPF